MSVKHPLRQLVEWFFKMTYSYIKPLAAAANSSGCRHENRQKKWSLLAEAHIIIIIFWRGEMVHFMIILHKYRLCVTRYFCGL